jgi:Uma2 family endonuclease
MMAISEHSESAVQSDVSPWVGQRMTLDEFLMLPDEGPSLEYDDGVVTQKVAAKPVHGSIQDFLVRFIDQTVRPQRLGISLPETRFVTPGWAPVPDILFYRRERLRVRRAPADFTDPPDLIIEIVSPEQTLTSLMKKCQRYLTVGVPVALVVEPGDETVLVFRPGQPLQILQGDDRIDLDDVLPGLNLTVRALFEAVNWSWLDDEGNEDEAAPAETQ